MSRAMGGKKVNKGVQSAVFSSGPIPVDQGSRDRVPQTRGLNIYFSQFWRLGAPGQGPTGLVSSEALSLAGVRPSSPRVYTSPFLCASSFSCKGHRSYGVSAHPNGLILSPL